MQSAATGLWRARLAVTAVLLFISTAAVIIGHHQAWIGDRFYQASLRDDSYFVLAAMIAFGAAAIGVFSRPYFLTVNFALFYLAVLNVKTLVAGEFVLVGDHGCVACIEGALVFANDMPAYVIAGLLAATLTSLLDHTAKRPARRTQVLLAIAALLIVALVASEVQFLYFAQTPYVIARLLRLLPYVIAALVGTISTILATHTEEAKTPPRLFRTRLGLAALLVCFVLLVNVLNTLRG